MDQTQLNPDPNFGANLQQQGFNPQQNWGVNPQQQGFNPQQNWGVNPQQQGFNQLPEPIKKPGFYQRYKKLIILFSVCLIFLIVFILIHVNSKDGQFSNWSTWSTCDKTCGDGTQFRTRTYIPPVHFGSDLQDKDKLKEIKKCNQGPCTNWAGFEYSTDNRCGPVFGNNKACPNNLCCSIGGWCGNTEPHCAQFGSSAARSDGSYSDGLYNDTRPSYLTSLIDSTSRNWNNQQYSTTKTSNGQIRCGPGIGACPYSQCCSTIGYCGHTGQFCAQVGATDAFGVGSHSNGIYNDKRPSYNTS